MPKKTHRGVHFSECFQGGTDPIWPIGVRIENRVLAHGGFRTAVTHSPGQFSVHLSLAVLQGKHHLDRRKAPSSLHRVVKNAILRCPGLECMIIDSSLIESL